MENAVSAPAAETAYLAQIDWQRPWLESVWPSAQALLASLPPACSGAQLRAALSTLAAQRNVHNPQALPVQFVAQECLPAGCAYESFIFAEGLVPSRDNLHDLFNALVWLAWPSIKKELNRLQAAQIMQHGIGQVRGALRDAVTLFDENAALLMIADNAAGDALLAALRAHAWHSFFSGYAASAKVFLFGHALMEKLVQPYKAITAHSWVVRCPQALLAADLSEQMRYLDNEVAQQLQTQAPSAAQYLPLPVAGIPGWWAQQDAAFYADAKVFRPARKPKLPA